MTDQAALYRYHVLRAATVKFHCPPQDLTASQRQEVEQLATRTLALENSVLATPEAALVVLTAQQIDRAWQAIADRYPDQAQFAQDLQQHQLQPADIRVAVQRELQFEAVLNQVAADQPPVTAAEVHAFYVQHPDRFYRPPQRTARHILITINPSYPENEAPVAQQRAQALYAQLQGADVTQFSETAQRYSECPSAVDGGRLGCVSADQLYPELAPALFALAVGECTPPVQSPLGYHILFCEQIHEPQQRSFASAQPQIQALLEQQRRQAAQKAWLAQHHKRCSQ
jgi:peptidyl-prolyl cis-trans isomerase C